MLIFSSLLKKLRKEKGLSQLELVEEITKFDSSLQNINTVTLSRWERDVTEPPLIRMLKVLKYFNFDTKLFLKHIHFEPSQSQIKSFEKGLQQILDWHLFGVFTIDDPDTSCSIEFKQSGKTTFNVDYELLSRVNYVTSFVSGSNCHNLTPSDVRLLQAACEDGRLVAQTCVDTLNNSLYAHGCNIAFDSNYTDFFKRKFELRDLSIVDLVKAPKTESVSILATPLVVFSEDWYKFCLRSLIEQSLKFEHVHMIYIYVIRQDAVSTFKSMGFELIHVIQDKQTNTKRHIVGCSFEKLITNHGLLKYLRTFF
ncbi:helix-turn-helix domain-containing protein [Vibrio owensii]|uniref:helix-turn-helix domain-containing protein n=1 Tax=Vibrio owensii TaxID=696485 RepID=UPI00222000BF|nr:helix-turn-helix transcriptional regulator [Vibrio owensii]